MRTGNAFTAVLRRLPLTLPPAELDEDGFGGKA